jgi:ribosome modulation factor
MDTLGVNEIAGFAMANGRKAPGIAGRPSDAPPDTTVEATLDLLRPRLLIRLLDRKQMVELIAAAIGSPANPFQTATQNRIYRGGWRYAVGVGETVF